MKKWLLFSFLIPTACLAQENDASLKEKLLAEVSNGACNCIDSIDAFNKDQKQKSDEVHRCIDEKTGVYLVGSKLSNIEDLEKFAKEDKNGNKQVDVNINLDKNSDEYKGAYFELERYLMDSCSSIKSLIGSHDKINKNSVSDNEDARQLYSSGVDEVKNNNWEKATEYFERSVILDPNFAFAWDNLGLCYRNTGKLDKALNAYKKSLSLDPDGVMPLQNIAIVYEFKEQYNDAIKAYKHLAEIDKDNPEANYGIGRIYIAHLSDYEKGLDYLCQAYNMYVEQNSPYRTDAESLINKVYQDMKKNGKEQKCIQIMKNNHINMKDE